MSAKQAGCRRGGYLVIQSGQAFMDLRALARKRPSPKMAALIADAKERMAVARTNFAEHVAECPDCAAVQT